jgi:hypothetical protein
MLPGKSQDTRLETKACGVSRSVGMNIANQCVFSVMVIVAQLFNIIVMRRFEGQGAYSLIHRVSV